MLNLQKIKDCFQVSGYDESGSVAISLCVSLREKCPYS